MKPRMKRVWIRQSRKLKVMELPPDSGQRGERPAP